MNTFIHTFSISVNMTIDERKRLLIFRRMPLTGTYKNEKYDDYIIEFCTRGVQIYIKKRTGEEIRYDKRHRPFKMEIIVTPYKLLNPEKCLGIIKDDIEWKEAFQELDRIVDIIENTTEIRIKENYKIQRVDITCDVITPTDIYSKEIIAASKCADLPYGYQKYEPMDDVTDLYGWNEENGSLFYNKNQKILAKIYNKKENIYGSPEYQSLEGKGLVRFELGLTRKFLKKENLLKDDNLIECLFLVREQAEDLFTDYFILNLYADAMFSTKVLKDYLTCKYAGRTYEQLLDFCKMAEKCKKLGVPFSADQCEMSRKAFNGCMKKFDKIGISPIPAAEACPYIPSVEQMLNGEAENKYIWYAQKKTRGKDVWGI